MEPRDGKVRKTSMVVVMDVDCEFVTKIFVSLSRTRVVVDPRPLYTVRLILENFPASYFKLVRTFQYLGTRIQSKLAQSGARRHVFASPATRKLCLRDGP